MFDLSEVNAALEQIGPGMTKYLHIMSRLNKTDVSKDVDFQKNFNGFYRMRQRKPEFYQEYYYFMEEHKEKKIDFETVLYHFYDKFDRVEASFSSKMLATLNPHMPVWDEFVLNNLDLKKPSYSSKNRLSKTVDVYNQIIYWYEDFLETDDAKEMIALFDKKYPQKNLTDTKKIDLILWKMR